MHKHSYALYLLKFVVSRNKTPEISETFFEILSTDIMSKISLIIFMSPLITAKNAINTEIEVNYHRHLVVIKLQKRLEMRKIVPQKCKKPSQFPFHNAATKMFNVQKVVIPAFKKSQ